jgi:unsaturated rhamnogalacturonyl hydrolase
MKRSALPGAIVSAAALVALISARATSGAGTDRAETPLESVRRVADKVIRETSFQFRVRPQRPSDDIQFVDLGFNRATVGTGIVRSAADTAALLGISHSVPAEIWINGASVYAGRLSTSSFREFAYSMYEFPVLRTVRLHRGENRIRVVAHSADSSARVILAFLDSGGRIAADLSFVNVAPDSSGAKWIYAAEFRGDSTDWKRPRVRMVKDDVIPPEASFRSHSYFEWHYANGQLAYAILALGDATGEREYCAWVEKYCGTTLSTLEEFRRQYEVERTGFNYRLFRRGMLDDAAAPALPFMGLARRGMLAGARPLIDTMEAWLASGQTRLADGTFCRPEPEAGTVWADDLFMSVMFLLRYEELTAEPKYLDEAVSQSVGIFSRLHDPVVGLSAHGWFEREARRSTAFWGRANGWMAWGISELLLRLPTEHPGRPRILEIFRQQMSGILRFQGENGLWHQVLDKPETYEETSCTAMFVLAMARGVRTGWLGPEYMGPVRRGWSGVCSRIIPDGTVTGICQGTPIGPDFEFYAKRSTPPHDPRGLGAVITAGIEMQQLTR